jgi:hypothetical protein
MTALADAWKWYQDAKRHLQAMRRLANTHWGELPHDKLLDDRSQKRVVEDTTAVLASLDDLAVVLLFSVFEAEVRERVVDGLTTEREGLRNPVLRKAADAAVEGIEVGSFARVLEPFKSADTVDLIEQVNQVRKYRNWVAHGKRENWRSEAVSPQDAYARLGRFLAVLGVTDEPPEAG